MKFAESVYYGFWFAPEFELMRKMIDETQKNVTGDVRLKLYRGNVIVVGRRSPYSLYDERVATFEADTVYNQRDAEGFIKLNALRLRLERQVDDHSVNCCGASCLGQRSFFTTETQEKSETHREHR